MFTFGSKLFIADPNLSQAIMAEKSKSEAASDKEFQVKFVIDSRTHRSVFFP